ncbi:GntR family transcriptional regulator [Terrarubrum flagellatum]|uniref:GntR family transcriptional regulator n=1 Tax=Terrirubrum flagellatum TaxID=2895980 RepID=UPI0031450A12
MQGPSQANAERKADISDLVDRIVRDIQSGALAPGMWLKQIDLEQRYSRSRPDVRRALDHLAQKRLVQHIPNRGYHVYEPDSAQTNDVLEIRLMLETGVADRVVANARPQDVAKLSRLARMFDDLMMQGTILELYEANLAFHRELLTLGGNRELVSLISELRHRTSSAPASQWRTRARIERSSSEHHAMVAAIEAKDTARLKHVIELHIRQPAEAQSAQPAEKDAAALREAG